MILFFFMIKYLVALLLVVFLFGCTEQVAHEINTQIIVPENTTPAPVVDNTPAVVENTTPTPVQTTIVTTPVSNIVNSAPTGVISIISYPKTTSRNGFSVTWDLNADGTSTTNTAIYYDNSSHNGTLGEYDFPYQSGYVIANDMLLHQE